MVDQERLVTSEQFEAWIRRPENAERSFELINGDIVEKMPTQLHAAIVHLLNGFLFLFLQKNPIGWALTEARYQLPDDDENARIPDISFILGRDRKLIDEGAAPYMPDLAVEVQSPGQSDKFMLDKATYYLNHGTRLVWLIYPDRRIVEVLTPDDRHLLNETGTLEGSDLLPGFSVAVKDIFPTA